MTIKDWLGSPREWGEFGRRATGWLNLLVDEVNDLRADQTATQADLDALEAATLAVTTAAITFAPNVANYGGAFDTLKVFKTRDGVVTINGLIQNNSGGALPDGSAVAQLPAGYRPIAQLLTVGLRSAGACRVDFLANGQIAIAQFAWPNADFLAIHASYQAA